MHHPIIFSSSFNSNTMNHQAKRNNSQTRTYIFDFIPFSSYSLVLFFVSFRFECLSFVLCSCVYVSRSFGFHLIRLILYSIFFYFDFDFFVLFALYVHSAIDSIVLTIYVWLSLNIDNNINEEQKKCNGLVCAYLLVFVFNIIFCVCTRQAL